MHTLTAKAGSGRALQQVQLVPTTSLSVLFDGVPCDWPGEITVALQSELGEQGLLTLRPAGGIWRAAGPCIPGQRLAWSVGLRAANEMGGPSGTIEPLAVGEARTVQLCSEGMVRTNYRLVGPSDELRPFLRPCDEQGRDVSMDAAGRFVVWSREPVVLGMRTATKVVCLRQQQGEGEIVVEPVERLVGVGLIDAMGKHAPCSAPSATGPSEALVYPVVQLPQPLLLAVCGGKYQRYEAPRFDAVDLVWLPVQTPPPTTTVTVELVGRELDAQTRRCFGVRLVQGECSTDYQSLANTMQFEVSGAGEFRLQWNFMGRQSFAENAVTVVAGHEVRLRVKWPVADVWTGEVQGIESFAGDAPLCHLTFGDGADAIRTVSVQRGVFTGVFEPGTELLPPVMLRRLTDGSRVPCEIVQRDDARRHLVLRASEEMHTVRLQVDMPGPWHVMLFANDAIRPSLDGEAWSQARCLRTGDQYPLLLHTSERLGGVLMAGLQGPGLRAAGWFSLDASQPTLIVRPTGGHEVELVPTWPLGVVALVGPQDQLAYLRRSADSGPWHVFVPEGTVSLFAQRPDTSYRQFPVGAAARMVLE